MADKETPSEQSSGGINRWWENYVVRYFVGSVVGAVLAALINQWPTSPFRGYLIPPELKDSVYKEIPWVGLLGLAFCYFASAPVLAIHSGRAYLRLSQLRRFWQLWVVVPVAVILCFAAWAYKYCMPFDIRVGSTGLLAAIVTIQLLPLLAGFLDRGQVAQNFYWALSFSRAKIKPPNSPEDKQMSEYVESYRHLREHGNAYTILLLELAFAFILVALPPRFLGIVFALWILPASLCWIVGTTLEFKLVDDASHAVTTTVGTSAPPTPATSATTPGAVPQVPP